MADTQTRFKSTEQASFYEKLSSQLLQLLSDRIISYARNDEFDIASWFGHINKIYNYMTVIEETKLTEPKLSTSFEKLIEYFKVITVRPSLM